MTRKRVKRDLQEEMEERKRVADALWDEVYRSVLAGKIDLGYIYASMNRCNQADRRLLELERRNSKCACH